LQTKFKPWKAYIRKKQHLTYANIETGVGTITDFKYNHDGRRIIVLGSNNNFAEVWNADTQQLVCKLMDKTPISAVNFHPNPDIVITVHPQNILNFWHSSSGKYVLSIELEKYCSDTYETSITE